MMKKIKIKTKTVEMEAELNDSRIAQEIWKALPIISEINTWGKEIYFNVLLRRKLENPKTIVKIGEIGYWPQGPALCIFFGPTPISKPGEIRPASAVEIVGKILGNPEDLINLRDGEEIRIEKIERNG